MPPSKQLTIQAIQQTGYSRLEKIFTNRKIVVRGIRPGIQAVAVNQNDNWINP